MAYRFGNDYLVEIKQETQYGQAPSFVSGATILPDGIEMKPTREPVQVRMKTGLIDPRSNEVLAGRKGGRVVMKGELTEAHEILLHALTGASSTPYSVTNDHVPRSYTIRQYFLTDSKGHQAVGCVLESLKITGEGNRPIQYEAVWRAREVTSENLFAGDNGGTVVTTAGKPFLFGDVDGIGILNNRYHDLNSITLNFSREFADDAVLYQTSMSKQREFLTGFSGELSFEALYDSAVWNSAGWLEDYLLSGDVEETKTSLTLNGVAKTWAMAACGRLSEVNPADPEKQVYVLSATLRLMGEAGNPSFVVEILDRQAGA